MKDEWKKIAEKVKLGLNLTDREKSIYILYIASNEEASKMVCMN